MIIGNKRSIINGSSPDFEVYVPLSEDSASVEFGDYLLVDTYSEPSFCKKQEVTEMSYFSAIALNSANPGEIVRCGFVGVHYVSDDIYNNRVDGYSKFEYASLHAGFIAKNLIYIDWTTKYLYGTFEVQWYNGNNSNTTPVVTFIYTPTLILHVPGYPRGTANMNTYGMTSLINPDVSNVDDAYQNTMYTISKNGSIKTVLAKQNQISGFESNNHTKAKFSMTCDDSDWQAVYNNRSRQSCFIGFFTPLFTYGFDWFEYAQ